MFCASLIKLVGTNKNACFIISKDKFLISLNLKLCASLIPHAINRDVLLSTKKLLKDHKASKIIQFNRINHCLLGKNLKLFVGLDKNAEIQIVDLTILRDKVEINQI